MSRVAWFILHLVQGYGAEISQESLKAMHRQPVCGALVLGFLLCRRGALRRRHNRWLLSEKCNWRSGPLNPWSCGVARFPVISGAPGEAAFLPRIKETWADGWLAAPFLRRMGLG